MTFENAFNNIDNILYQDAGSDSELDYIEQTSWVLFLRYLNDLEKERADEAALRGEDYEFIFDEKYRGNHWAVPLTEDGEIDYQKIWTGDDLVEFVDNELFPHLTNFKVKSRDNPKSLEYKIGEIFGELRHKILSGYNQQEILQKVDELKFQGLEDKHELSHLYEANIKNMGNAGCNGGQYYVLRPLIWAMDKVVHPKVWETVYNGVAGYAGFLCETFEYMYEKMEKTVENFETLQERTFYDKEKKSFPYIIGVILSMIVPLKSGVLKGQYLH